MILHSHGSFNSVLKPAARLCIQQVFRSSREQLHRRCCCTSKQQPVQLLVACAASTAAMQPAQALTLLFWQRSGSCALTMQSCILQLQPCLLSHHVKVLAAAPNSNTAAIAPTAQPMSITRHRRALSNCRHSLASSMLALPAAPC